MRWIVATSLRFRYLVAGLAVALLYFGVTLAGSQKLDVFPEFAPVSVEIQTNCLGLSPSQIESLTTVPLEAALHGVPGVYDIRSDSEPQLSAIYLYFGGHERAARQAAGPGAHPGDRAHAAVLVRRAADVPDRVRDQPGDADRAVVEDGLADGPVDDGAVAAAAPADGRAGRRQRRDLGREAQAAHGRGRPGADGREPRRHGRPDDRRVQRGGRAASSATPPARRSARSAWSRPPTSRSTCTTSSRSPRRSSWPRCRSPSRTGKILNLGDVSDVTWGYPPLIGDAVINGGPGLMLVVEKFPGANTLDVTNGIDKALAAMAPSMPGVHINNQIFRQASFIQIAIHNLSQSVLLGCILVVFVLLMFLFQWRAALVSLLAIPLSLAAAEIVLVALGTTINTMILAGFAVAVGVVVDDAIIDMENIVRRLRAWRAAGRHDQPVPRRARRVARGAGRDLLRDADQHHRRHPGHAGRRPHRRVLRAAGPCLRAGGARLDGGGADGDAGPRLYPAARRQAQGGRTAGVRVLKRGYSRALSRALRAPSYAFGAVIVLALVGGFVYPHLGEDLFPSFKEPDFLMHFVTKPGTSVTEQDRMVASLQDQVLAGPRRHAPRAATSARPCSARRSPASTSPRRGCRSTRAPTTTPP